MNQELAILSLADYSEPFTQGGCTAYLIINKQMEDHPCLFGFTELSESLDDARAVFSAMEQRARELGYHEIVGPVNYCSWMNYRWAISNFDTKLFPDCTNPPYYVDFIKALGYRELYTYRSACIDINNPLFHVGKQLYRQKLQEGFTFRLYEGEDAFAMADAVFSISKEAFRGSYLYCDIPKEYFDKLYLSWVKGLRLAMYVAFRENEPVGYVMGYDSPYGDCFVSKTSAVRTDFQKHKLYTALLYLGCKYVLDKGYKDMMYHFQCEQKDIFRRFEKEIESNEKRYAVFRKEL